MKRRNFYLAITLVFIFTLTCVIVTNNKADDERSQLESRASVCIEMGMQFM